MPGYHSLRIATGDGLSITVLPLGVKRSRALGAITGWWEGRVERLAAYVAAIRRAEPALAIDSATLRPGGQNSDIVVINDDLLARFPRYEDVRRKLVAESSILNAVQDLLPLPVPAPLHLHLEELPLGEAFMAYRRIPGEPLWRETFRAIEDGATRQRLAEELGGFLRALHGLPCYQVLPISMAQRDTRAQWADTYARVREQLFPRMRPDARAEVARHFEAYLGDGGSTGWDPVLKHGDFGTGNLLYDAAARRMSGVIDFGSAGPGDPAYDFAGLLSSYGVAFLGRCESVYPGLEAMLPRVRFYQGTFALLEALFGLEHDDAEALRAGLAAYT